MMLIGGGISYTLISGAEPTMGISLASGGYGNIVAIARLVSFGGGYRKDS